MKTFDNQIRRLAIGTAQFGSNYGVANRSGQVSFENVQTLLDYGRAVGVETLDTAIDYGNCEQVLGAADCNGLSIITKLPTVPTDCGSGYQWIIETVKKHISNLNQTAVYGLLLHDPTQLQTDRGTEIFDALYDLKDEGVAEKIGLSIYEPEILDRVYSKFEFDLIQVPLNILDRQVIESGWLQQLSMDNVEVHARSVFLQGLLTLPRLARPDYFDQWAPLFSVWDNWRDEVNRSSTEACINFCLGFEEVSKVVVGVDHLSQLKEVVEVFESGIDLSRHSIPKLSSSDRNLLDPGYWPKGIK